MGSLSRTMLALLVVPAGLLVGSAAGETSSAAPPQLVLVQPRAGLAAAAESVRDAGGPTLRSATSTASPASRERSCPRSPPTTGPASTTPTGSPVVTTTAITRPMARRSRRSSTTSLPQPSTGSLTTAPPTSSARLSSTSRASNPTSSSTRIRFCSARSTAAAGLRRRSIALLRPELSG